MKKALSVILSVLVIFSMFGVAAAAADDDGLVTVKFVIREEGKEDVVLRQLQVAPGLNFVDRIVAGGDAEVGVPTKESTDTTEYIFKGWLDKNNERVFTANIPAVSQADYDKGVREVVYVADFAEQDIKENQSFWAFVQSIFERINMIFEYFAKVFEGVLAF